MTSKPKCPYCQHVMTDDEMNEADEDLLAIATNEEDTNIFCPRCDELYLCRGGYLPTYQSTANPEGFEA